MDAHMLHRCKPQLQYFEEALFKANLEVNFVSHGTTTFVDVTKLGVNKASSLKKVAQLE